jgi:hypothetical protein
MGVDLSGRGRGFGANWSAWEELFTLGRKYGWKPKGTHASRFFELMNTMPLPRDRISREISIVDGGPAIAEALKTYSREGRTADYFSNNGQVVTREDAAAWADALDKALADEALSNSRRSFTEDFIQYCRHGEFLIW